MAALLFPRPGGSILYVVSPYLLAAFALVLGYAELSGNNLGYSKFGGGNTLAVPSKVGMFLMYFPADLIASVFLAYGVGFLPGLLKSCGASGVASLVESKEAAVAASDTRLWLVVAAVFLHFSKRCLEVCKPCRVFPYYFCHLTNILCTKEWAQ